MSEPVLPSRLTCHLAVAPAVAVEYSGRSVLAHMEHTVRRKRLAHHYADTVIEHVVHVERRRRVARQHADDASARCRLRERTLPPLTPSYVYILYNKRNGVCIMP